MLGGVKEAKITLMQRAMIQASYIREVIKPGLDSGLDSVWTWEIARGFCAINLHGIIDGMILSSRATHHVCRSTGRGIQNCQIASVRTRTSIITHRGFTEVHLTPSLSPWLN